MILPLFFLLSALKNYLTTALTNGTRLYSRFNAYPLLTFAPHLAQNVYANNVSKGLVSLNIGVKIRRLIAAFLYASLCLIRNGRVIKALARVAGPMSCRPTFFTLPPLIGLFVGRLYSCYIGQSIMNTPTTGDHAQKTKITPIFSIFWHRQILAQSVNFALAMRFKRRFPAVVVKFAGFEVAA